MSAGRWWWPLLVFLAVWGLAEFTTASVLLGIVAAVAVVQVGRLGARLDALEADLQALRQAAPAVPAPMSAPAETPASAHGPMPEAANTAIPSAMPAQAPVDATATATAAASQALPAAAPALPPALPPAPPPGAPPPREADERSIATTSSLGRSLKAWFTGGNTIVRLAVLILFAGVAFLVRYAAENALLPIELRLAGAVLGGLVMLGAGWRLRQRRPGYGLTLQGGGVGVVYLALFAAFRLYGLLPAGPALGLLVALGALTAFLALRQDALPLAVLAFAGAFLAPVLTSTGGGSHVALFSYYLVLNLAIAWLAGHRAWKLLNTLGFFFTFGIGFAWGGGNWQPGLLASTLPFVVAHFVLYLGITLQYSRQMLAAGDARLPLVDGGLLFGVPMATFGALALMLHDRPYALAVAAALMAGAYLLLTRWLWRQAGPRLRVLSEGLLALGVVFLALVAPLALDARWTSAAWALQGAGVLWVALRQQRLAALALGLLLQVLAAWLFWARPPLEMDRLAWLLNSRLLGVLLLALAALFSAWQLQRAALGGLASSGQTAEGRSGRWLVALLPWLHGLMLGLGLGLAQGLGGVALELLDPPWRRPDGPALVWLWLAGAAVLMALAARPLRWTALAAAGRALVSLLLALGMGELLERALGPEAGWPVWRDGGLLALAGLLATGLWMLRRSERTDWRVAGRGARRGDAESSGLIGTLPDSTAIEHLLLYGHALVAACTLAYALAGHFITRHQGWTPALALAAPLLLLGWFLARQRAGAWPQARHPQALQAGLAWPVLALAVLWLLLLNLLADGAMQPLPYVPLLNPVDLVHGLAAWLGLRLWRDGRPGGPTPRPALVTRVAPAAAGAVAFAWLNGLLLRSLHHWVGAPMWLDGAWDSALVQTALTLLWTVCALGAMFIASRRAKRPLWMAGAALLAVVVLKLLLVDLSHTGALMRIVSFLGVGVLMLVIGYLSPLPPARPAAGTGTRGAGA